ncbi:hypothetical protein KZC51_01465 [Microbacterium sp. SSW1-49]|uniref:Methyltransferase n=1 Tax=Microbacterium croceum TaxID=2851645 RepID=A0ABT0F9R0_9MICO|nr:hypothetical protein [Microbacterium croceum]MCK2034790.1 hypothetical protein [Microbacterium croceum]
MNDSSDRHPDVLWACVEDGFHVGSRVGEFLGYVDRQPDGSYAAFDARAQNIGRFDTLHDATSAVGSSDFAPAQPGDARDQKDGVVL